MIPIFDTHAHLDLESYDNDRDAVLARIESGSFCAGFTPQGFEHAPLEMTGVLVPGINAQSSRRCVELAGANARIHAAVGIHPNSLEEAGDWDLITQLAEREEVLAIGETGLDRHWDTIEFSVQIERLERHLKLSKRINKPILIHSRDAWDDVLPILRHHTGVSGVIHAFSGTAQQAMEAIELGYWISFAGSVTYRNAKFSPLWEAAKVVPAQRLLIETDAPFMTPHPYRGKLKRNEPQYAAVVALRLAELRKVSVEQIAETTSQNALMLLGKE